MSESANFSGILTEFEPSRATNVGQYEVMQIKNSTGALFLFSLIQIDALARVLSLFKLTL